MRAHGSKAAGIGAGLITSVVFFAVLPNLFLLLGFTFEAEGEHLANQALE